MALRFALWLLRFAAFIMAVEYSPRASANFHGKRRRSTAIVSKLLAERGELDTPHGREVMGVLLFQDLAVVPLIVLLPALGQPAGVIGAAVLVALGKAAVALAVVVVGGPRLMRGWLGAVARRRSNELFVLNVLFIALLLAWLTGLAGLSLVPGRLLARLPNFPTQYC